MKMFVQVFVALLYVSQHASAVETYEGEESVLLPCNFPTFDLDEASVVWSRSNLRPSTVHQRQPGGDDLKDQNQDYGGRTSMRTDALRTGDLSLTLRRPTTRDSGSYTCILRGRGGEESQSQVTLEVKGHPVNWDYIVIGVTGLLLSLAAAALLVYKIHKCMRKEGGRGCLPVCGIVPLVVLIAAVAVSSLILHKGIKDQVEPPPAWIAGLLGLLFLLVLLIPPCNGCRVCGKLNDETLYTEGRLRVKVWLVLLAFRFLLFLLFPAVVVLCGVMYHKGINTAEGACVRDVITS